MLRNIPNRASASRSLAALLEPRAFSSPCYPFVLESPGQLGILLPESRINPQQADPVMTLVQDIQQAIQQLTPGEREAIATWILESRYTRHDVAEPAHAYGTGPDAPSLSAEEYLRLEGEALTRHEFIGGEMFAMSGASAAHNLIVGNVVDAFRRHLLGGPCKTFFADFKVRLRADRDDIFYYPDVTVACGAIDLKTHYVTDPKVVVEVLSPSTEAIDRREKLINYRRIATLEEYALVAQKTSEVTLHRRRDRWKPLILSDGAALAEFPSIALSLPVADIYAGVL